MLKLANITKDYKVADTTVRALKGVSICFRENEFVSVLGPSGCGKTTMLNLIGGLDHATSGDLLIYGRSTKKYSDKDWDVYRNHRVGFIFQSYNLIPHQTVLGNVELALTIAGMDKAERQAKAKAALDKVGLADQYYKRPNQLSGGQCQRVAIARALVNDPEILLADEPTGALDTTTSKQIMDLIKEIAKERLVIMVTHNPELAEEYSTRIIRLLDGVLLSDSNPFSEEDEKISTEAALKRQAEKQSVAVVVTDSKKVVKKEKAKMSFLTAFKLSLQNLFTKKRRTIMTAVAGSIGIIGVSLVLSLSIGLQGFINNMQNDMLAGNPITIEQTTFDINSMMSFSTSEERAILAKGNYVNVEEMIKELKETVARVQNMRVQNKINKNYVDYIKDMPQEYWSALNFDYGLDVVNSVYTNFDNGNPAHAGRNTSLGGIKEMYSSVLKEIEGFEDYASYVGMLNSSFIQAPDARNQVTADYVMSQYNVLWSTDGTDKGGIAKEANEIMIVLSNDRALSDLTLGQIGYYSQDEFINMVNKAIENDDYKEELDDGGQIAYDKLAAQKYTWYPNNSIFTAQDRDSQIPFTYSPYADSAWESDVELKDSIGVELKIVGILEPKEDLSYGMLSSGVYYTTALAEHIVEQNWNSELAQYLREQKTDTLSGTAYVMKANGSTEDQIMIIGDDSKVIAFDYDYYWDGAPHVAKGLINGGTDMMSMIMSMMGMSVSGGSVSYSLQQLGANVESEIIEDESGKIEEINVLFDEDGKIFALPVGMAIYPPDFTQKDNVLAWLDTWNDENATITLSNGTVLTWEMREKVVYSDMLGLIMRMISTLITMITIALVGFTALLLIVSCVMIAIITYVSVVERIKEIGVIRSLGGRKRDVSNLFTAETFIIGLASGLIGIIVTYILSGLLNLIVGSLGVAAIAAFPIWVAAIMVGISVGLTLISGLMPSRSAAKKDPVVALRSE